MCQAPSAHRLQANSVFGALRALESLSQMLRRRRVPPGSALEELVPPEAIWPAEDEQQGGQRSEGQGSEGERAAGAAGSTAESGGSAGLPQRRRKKKDKTVLLVEEVDIYDSPRFRYRCGVGCGGVLRRAVVAWHRCGAVQVAWRERCRQAWDWAVPVGQQPACAANVSFLAAAVCCR